MPAIRRSPIRAIGRCWAHCPLPAGEAGVAALAEAHRARHCAGRRSGMALVHPRSAGLAATVAFGWERTRGRSSGSVSSQPAPMCFPGC